MVVAINNIVINGTDLKSSIKATQSTLITVILDRLPSANKIPAGRAVAIPIPEITKVRNSPPQRLLDISLKATPLITNKLNTNILRQVRKNENQ